MRFNHFHLLTFAFGHKKMPVKGKIEFMFHIFFFFSELEERKLDLEGEVFDMLFTLTDFLAFKEMFISYKISRQSTSLPLHEILSVTSL